MKYLLSLLVLFVAGCYLCAQGTYYVNPAAGGNSSADGSLANPYNDIAATVELRQDNGGGTVMVLGGTYDMSGIISISTRATRATRVTIRPATGQQVKFNFSGRTGFRFEDGARFITLEGFELDGNTDETDFWYVVAKDFWSVDGNPDGGGLAVLVDGEHITIKDNYIHDFYQKGVEIRNGRYVVVEGNIIQGIANTSLSGGHGIMRQQKGKEFFDDDNVNHYRWDIRENMISNVEQRIYSWVPSKGMINMVIDEGKSILIDDPKDSDGVQERMKARIKNNVVAYGSIDHIRLKSTPNLEVSNNSIYSQAEEGKGITDKAGDTGTPTFVNFIAQNNAVHTEAGINAFEFNQVIQQAGGTAVITNNHAMDGRAVPQSQPGLNRYTGQELFLAPNAGDFTINPDLNLPPNVGVDPAVLTALSVKAADFGAAVGWNQWTTDHLKLTQTILDNIPGLNDGVNRNETVLKDAGKMTAGHDKIVFRVANGSWKTSRDSPGKQDFLLNPVYVNWYRGIALNHPDAAGEEYERIRYGGSYVYQNQVFPDGWLTVSEITASSNTLLEGFQNDFILDGDLLVDFKNFTPAVGASFDLVTAGTIASANNGPLFDRVLFGGFTPSDYTLEIVNVQGRQTVRLTVLEAAPMDLGYFQGSVAGQGKHVLTWATSSDERHDYFEIQRSPEGREWEVLGLVAASGEAMAGGTYRFTDMAPLAGTNRYRLRPVSADGSFSYSTVVELDHRNEAAALAYPNPFGTSFSVPVSERAGRLRVFTAAGREVTGIVDLRVEVDRIVVSGERLTAGVYVVQYDDERLMVIKR